MLECFSYTGHDRLKPAVNDDRCALLLSDRKIFSLSIIPTLFIFFILLLPLNLKAAEPDKKQKITLQLAWKHQFQFAGYYAAEIKGYYKENGLDVILSEGGEGKFAREEVLSGRAQYGITGSELILHRIGGEPFVVLASIFQHSPSIILTKADSNILHPQALMGKRVMLLPENKDADILAVFQNENVPINSIIRIDQSYNIDDLIYNQTDAVSAYLTNEPWYMKQAGIRPGIIKPATYGVDFYSDCLFTTAMEVSDHPERVNDFLNASLRGWEYAMANMDEIIDYILTGYKVKKQKEHLRFEADAMRELILPNLIQIGHMNPGRWQHIADTYARLGMINTDYSLKNFIYEPNPEPDLRWIRWGGLIALFFCLFIGSVALVLFVFNRQLKAEIRERRKTEILLKDSEAEKKAILDGITANIAFIDKELKVIWVNKTAADSVNKKPEEMIGHRCHEFWADSSKPCDGCPTLRALKTKKSEQAIMTTSDGRIWSEHGEPVFDSKGCLIGVVEIAQDITDQKNTEKQLKEAQKMESIGTLTGGIAHDFNNFLGIILGNAELALADIPKWNPAYSKLKAIKTISLKGADIVSQLLSFSRRAEQQLKPLIPIPVVKDTIRLLRSTIPSTIEIRERLDSTDEMILADSVQLNQVIMNLCINSSQAMEESGGIIEIAMQRIIPDDKTICKHPELEKRKYLKLTVSDTGHGIEPHIVDRIFDPYFTTKEVGQGSGMGLAMVLAIVKSHNGRITLDSKPGRGTCFNIFFPVIKEKPDFLSVTEKNYL